MTKKYTFKKVLKNPDYVGCHYCRDPTPYVLYDPHDGSETWCCKYCLWIIGKIKRFNPKNHKKSRVTNNIVNAYKESDE